MNQIIIDRLNNAIETKTFDTLADLATIESQLDAALQTALAASHEKIKAATTRVADTFARNLVAAQQNIDRMVGDAIEGLLAGIASDLDATVRAFTEPETTPTPDVIPSHEEVKRDLDHYASEQEVETAPTATVAAHAIAYERPAVIDDDDDDTDDIDADPEVDADDDSALMEHAAEHEPSVATSNSADDLYERRGNGRGTRYTQVDLPTLGEIYYRKVDGRWTPVRYIGEWN